MKKILSFVLALALLLSMGVTAFASEVETPTVPPTNLEDSILLSSGTTGGTIKITNATKDQVYTVYKIFDAELVDGKQPTDKDGVTYTLTPGTAAFNALFPPVENGSGETVPGENDYFVFDPNSKQVSLKDLETDSATLVNYLQNLVKTNPNAFPHTSQRATDVSVEFDGLQYGYYLISCNLAAAATLDSNTPSVEVIDKSQHPGELIKQLKKKGQDDDWYETNKNTVTGIDSNTVNIGDVVTYKISFDASNYDGKGKIQYYEVFDVKGTGVWAEFTSFNVTVNNVSLPGYYLNNGGDDDNGAWSKLGDWTGYTEDKIKLENAKWYLVHTGYDTYSILIPWLEGHQVTSTENSGSVTVPNDGAFLYNTGKPAKVVITYNAGIEPNAYIGTSGNATGANLFNKAYLTWQVDGLTRSQKEDSVYSETFGLTLLKTDFKTPSKVLEGATFALTDADGDAIYVIPTGVDGVYMVDSHGKAVESITGTKMDTARDYFANLKDPNGNDVKVLGNDGQMVTVPNTELAALYETTDNTTTAKTTNLVVTPKSGRIVVLGLDLGTYKLTETDPPAGYNKLKEPVEITITKASNSEYKIYTDDQGNVANDQGTLYNDNTDIYTYTYSLTGKEVTNSQGAELPETGGEGRIMLITVGSLIAMGFAILLITQKKMSAYRG